MDVLTPSRLAEVLQEPEKALLGRVLKTLGQERCAQVLAETLSTEANGGMLIKSGARRRTPGGVFFELVKERCTGKERHYLFAPRPVKHASPGKPQAAPAPELAPMPLPLDLWKGLTPMPVTATLKLVLRDLPETRERDGMVYLALTNEPKGLPKNISLDSGPLYLTSPAKQWRAACTRAEQIRASGTPALLIIEAHVSTKEGALIGVVKGVQVVEGKATAQALSA
jgi:hypothetical protein